LKKKVNKKEAVHSFTVMPRDCNYNLDKKTNSNRILFGGKILYDLDFAAAKVARRATYGVDCDMVVTVKIGETILKKPAFIGDIITYTATVKAIGKTSLQILVKVTRESVEGDIEDMCTSSATFVTIKNMKSHPHGLDWKILEDEV